jgi:hypothetical protein
MYTADMGYVSREVCSAEVVIASTTHARIDGVSWSFSGTLLESHSYAPPLHINPVDFLTASTSRPMFILWSIWLRMIPPYIGSRLQDTC